MERKKRSNERICHFIAPLSPTRKKEVIPYVVVKLLTDAEVLENYQMKKELVAVRWDNHDQVLHIDDFNVARSIAEQIHEQHIAEKNLMLSARTIPVAMDVHREAAKLVKSLVDDETKGKKKLLFAKDQSGCGYWRMVVPSRYMDAEKCHIDITEMRATYEYLLDYDVVVIQRLCTWQDYYTILRLKKHGKRVVYDLDDNIFHVPPDNPAAAVIKRDELEAARAIMNICDTVTTTTETLKHQLGCPDKTIVIPNAIDLDDGYPAEFQGSKDKFKRILWMGGGSHGLDWKLCVEAVDKVLSEREDVRLTLVGCIPDALGGFLSKSANRIEFERFKYVETYVSLTKRLRAEVALAPLRDTTFNRSKSNIKWLEYTAVGIPTVASNVIPYSNDIVNGENGVLASSSDEWYRAILMFLDHPEKCRQVVVAAKKTVEEKFDIKRIVCDWEAAILG